MPDRSGWRHTAAEVISRRAARLTLAVGPDGGDEPRRSARRGTCSSAAKNPCIRPNAGATFTYQRALIGRIVTGPAALSPLAEVHVMATVKDLLAVKNAHIHSIGPGATV